MGTCRNWIGRFMYVSTTKKTVDLMTRPNPGDTIERVHWISCGISRITFGLLSGLRRTSTLRLEAMKRTEDACCGGWCDTTLTSQRCLSTIGELGSCSYWFPFSA